MEQNALLLDYHLAIRQSGGLFWVDQTAMPKRRHSKKMHEASAYEDQDALG